MMKNNVLVMGGSSSVGQKLILELLRHGYFVISQYRRLNKNLQDLSIQYPDNLHLVQSDLNNQTSLDEFTGSLGRFGTLFGVIHLPSPPIILQPIHRIDWSDFETHLIVQLKSLQQVIMKCLKDMKKADGAYIISISSDAIFAEEAPKGFTAYAVAKAALHQYLKCLRSEVKDHDVQVYQIVPGMFKSPLLDNIPDYVVEQTIGSSKLDASSIQRQNEIVKNIIKLLRNSHQSDVEIFV